MSTETNKAIEAVIPLKFGMTQSGQCFALSNPYLISQNDDISIDMKTFEKGGSGYVNFGVDNKLPLMIDSILSENNLAPGILTREKGLLYGQGLKLYKEVLEDGSFRKEWTQDEAIQAWLDSWDYKNYVRQCLWEFKVMNGFFVKFIKTKDNRSIHHLEFISNSYCRCVAPTTFIGNLSAVDRFYLCDFNNNSSTAICYPRFSKKPNSDVSIDYYRDYTLGGDYYALPAYIGALEWIKCSSAVPKYIKHLTDNSITAIYHVHSPERYWDNLKEEITTNNPSLKPSEILEKLEEKRIEKFNSFSETLSGSINAGKFLETIDFVDDRGVSHSWKIEKIDQNIDKTIDAHLAVKTAADSATTSGIGIPPALSNIVVEGQLSSGSQSLYAYKLYLASDVTIPEEIILEPLNKAIKFNFPNTTTKVGFYRPIVKTEDSIHSGERIKNKI